MLLRWFCVLLLLLLLCTLLGLRPVLILHREDLSSLRERNGPPRFINTKGPPFSKYKLGD